MTTWKHGLRLLALILLPALADGTLRAQRPMEYRKTKASISGNVTGAARAGADEPAAANASFKVVEGAAYTGQAPLMTFRTDNNGNFHLDLPPGVYSIVERDRAETFTLKKSTPAGKWDNRCRKKLWQTPLLVVQVRNLEAQQVSLSGIPADESTCLKQASGHGK